MKPWDINISLNDPIDTRDTKNEANKITKIIKVRDNEFLICYIDFVFVLGE